MKKETELLNKSIKFIKDFMDHNGFSVDVEESDTKNFDRILHVPELQERLYLVVKKNFFASFIPRLRPAITQELAHRNLIIITEKLTMGTFEACIKNNIFILDEQGNGRIRIGNCFYERFVQSESAKKQNVSGTPFSAKASRLVRAFLAPPGLQKTWTQSELAKKADISQSYASKQLLLLKSKGYISFIADVYKLEEPEQLLGDWQAHYRFDRHQKKQYALSFSTYDDGLEKLAKNLKRLGLKFAFTGWSGSYLRAPYGTSNQLMAYVSSFPEENSSSALFPVKDKGNVLLYLPQDEGVFQFQQQVKALPIVSDAQLYLDLKEMPGRASEQAEVLRKTHLTFEENNA